MFRGVFWITTLDDVNSNRAYALIPCDHNGVPVGDTELNSKNQYNLNHEHTWKSFSSEITNNKPYNYYPRGRVEIRKGGKAIIYMNPHINTPEIVKWVIKVFELEQNDLRIDVKNDGSNHYKCYLDRDV